jgi:hypothetical protein
LGGGVAVSLEGTVDNIRPDIDHVWHDWLILRTVPRHVSRLSLSVPVGGSVVLMVDGGLSGSPLSVSVWERGVLGKNLSQVPEEQIWVVHQRLGVERVIVHDDRLGGLESSAETSAYEVDDPGISEPASDVEALDGEFSDHEKTEGASELSPGCVVGPVEVRFVNGSGNNRVHVVSLEPGSQL